AELLQVRRFYLFCYNILQASGWAFSLLKILGSFLSSGSVNGAYSSAGELISFLQTLAFLEVLHGALGIVPSGFLLPLMQWGGRTHFLLAVLRRIHEIQDSASVFITFAAWSSSEVIRYSHYALNCIGNGNPPDWITFLRYNAFIVLYPIGVFPGEMWSMYRGLPFMKRKNLYGDRLPFAYCDFVKVLLLCYPFLWMKLYLHLFSQRRAKL
ncbi:hypothetical protein M569_02817, partial [Genlisea aurea]